MLTRLINIQYFTTKINVRKEAKIMTKDQLINLIAQRITDYAVKEINVSERIRHTPPYSRNYDVLNQKYLGYTYKRKELQDLMDSIYDIEMKGEIA